MKNVLFIVIYIYIYIYIYIAQKKLPKWLRNICITKKCVFNNLKKITHYYNNGFEEDIYIYNIYTYNINLITNFNTS